MTEPQRIQPQRTPPPTTRPLTAQDRAESLLREARTLLGQSVGHEGTAGERQSSLDALMARAAALPEGQLRAETADRLRTVLGELEGLARSATEEDSIASVDWMSSRAARGRQRAARPGRVPRAAARAMSAFRAGVHGAPAAATHGRVSDGAAGLTRRIVANLDSSALAANFTRQQLTQAATQAGAPPGLAEQLVRDISAQASERLASSMIDVAQARLRGLSADLHAAAMSPDELVRGLITSPLDGLRLLQELGVPGDELRRLSADINRLNDRSLGLGETQRSALRGRITGRAMGLAEDASRAAEEAAGSLEELRHEDPDRILATFPWAAEDAARSLSIDHATAARIARGNGTGSLLARAVYDRRSAIESHDRWVNVGIKAGIILAQIATTAVAGPLASALLGTAAEAANGLREVTHARELARLTQGAAATGLNSHAAARAARREADSAETAAVAAVAIGAAEGLSTAHEVFSGARSGAAHFDLGEAATEAVEEADIALDIANVENAYLRHAEEADTRP